MEEQETRCCEWCGKPLIRKRRDNGRMETEKVFHARRFCDNKCKGFYNRRQHLTEKQCVNCGKSFFPSKNDERIRFCCTECQLEYRKKTGYMENYYQENKDRLAEYKKEYNPHRNEARRSRYQKDAEYREYAKQRAKEYNATHPKAKREQRMRKYGIALDDYNAMWEKQKGRCLICGEKKEKKGKYNSLYVDHNHMTGKVRGLLCQRCNFLIGQARDNVKILRNAIRYLEMTDKEVKDAIDENQLSLFDFIGGTQ